jgi:DnaJ-class molecular chaperone
MSSNAVCPSCGAWGLHACTGPRAVYTPPVFPPPRAPVLCPVCHGKLTVEAGFYMDGGTLTAREKCRTCNGRGVV